MEKADLMQLRIDDFQAAYQRNKYIKKTFYDGLTEILNRLRENDPRISGLALEIKTNSKANRDINAAILTKLDTMSDKTYSLIKNSKSCTSLRTIISICIVLCLDLDTSNWLLKLAGLALSYSKEDQVYAYMIQAFSDDEKKLDNCNKFLKSVGVNDVRLGRKRE